MSVFFLLRTKNSTKGFDRDPEIDRGYHLYKKEGDPEKLGRVAEASNESRTECMLI